MTTVYISIGNSDDKLTQAEWARYRSEVGRAIDEVATEVHGAWVSPSGDPWQNACWCASLAFHDSRVPWLRKHLRQLAAEFRQDSIAWAEAPVTEFIGPGGTDQTSPPDLAADTGAGGGSHG